MWLWLLRKADETDVNTIDNNIYKYISFTFQQRILQVTLNAAKIVTFSTRMTRVVSFLHFHLGCVDDPPRFKFPVFLVQLVRRYFSFDSALSSRKQLLRAKTHSGLAQE